MQIEKITPISIASNPMMLNVDPATYCHTMQMNKGVADWVTTTTFNGTQKFDHKGKPCGNDND